MTKTYSIEDRGYDYVLTIDGGFWQRVPNLSILRKAVRNWRAMGYVRQEPEFDRINHGPFEHPVSEPVSTEEWLSIINLAQIK